MPKSFASLRKTIYFYIVILSLGQVIIVAPVAALIKVFIELAFTLFFIWLILLIKHKTEMFVQLSTAFLGCQSFLGIIGLPLLVWVSIAESGEVLIPFYTLIFIVFWLIDVLMNLLKKTVMISNAVSLSLIIPYLLITFVGSFVLLM